MTTTETESLKLNDDEIATLLERIQLKSGGHGPPRSPDQVEACVMEMVAYIAGEAWSDHPKCACPVITGFAIRLNDRATDEARQLLKPIIPKLVGTRSTPAVETRRRWMISDWAVRIIAPMAFDSARLPDLAKRLRDLPEVTPESYQGARKVCLEVRDAARAERAKRSAAADAAYAAAADAAADAADAAADAADAADAAAYAAAADAESPWKAHVQKAWNDLMPEAVKLLARMAEVAP